ncbi:metal ABC transporter substrate-binding protein [Marmoricola endophyticus]|uniref:Metal ABC transporter substrate-binding protein n=1 Tax=Marmoricola endophyticus TaxID=2040280 RepID=A0A917F097_9ACTN|nr:zinc ABC transporter substrate-binding protein [Marmoricola endophyticus]GGF32067.1 metal ABC transporter substrate-binding protein [Marmoricola endophyticus]
MPTTRTPALAALALLAAGALTACGSQDSADDGTVRLVASTDVWGSVAEQVVGDVDGVEVTSIIDDPSKDPHTYEASTRTQLALSRADVVVENGGGYDDFMGSMLKNADSKATVLDAVEISGKKAPSGGELNEHVWYDLPTAAAVAEKVCEALTEADPDDGAAYDANTKAFTRKLDGLERAEAAIKQQHAGEGVAITEPVPGYLLEAAGLENETPAEFSEAIEEDTDVSPAVLKQTLDLFSDKSVRALVYNEQTSGPQTQAVLKAARAADVPVVPVTETLPAGKDYLTWMKANIAAVQSALGR